MQKVIMAFVSIALILTSLCVSSYASDYEVIGYASVNPFVTFTYEGVVQPSLKYNVNVSSVDYYSDTVAQFSEPVHFVRRVELEQNVFQDYSGLMEFYFHQTLDPIPAFEVADDEFVRIGFALAVLELNADGFNNLSQKISIENGLSDLVFEYSAYTIEPLIVGQQPRGYMLNFYVPSDSFLEPLTPGEPNQGYSLKVDIATEYVWAYNTSLTFDFSELRLKVMSATDVVTDAINNNTQLIINSNSENADKIIDAMQDTWSNPAIDDMSNENAGVQSRADAVLDGLDVGDIVYSTPDPVVYDTNASGVLNWLFSIDFVWTFILTACGLWLTKVILYGIG